jgi:phage baseplate assembly protein W
MLGPKSYLGRGWKFPVRLDAEELVIQFSEYDQDIRESIWIILSTAKGERLMRPDFGCGIHDLVFEAINAGTLAEIENSIRAAVATFEPRIDVAQVAAKSNGATEGRLNISIDYYIRGTNNLLNLVYPFYVRERG